MQFPNNGFIVIKTEPVHWRNSATEPAAPNEVFSPVWLTDALGIRAAIFLRCPQCRSPLGVNPATRADQDDWQKQPPELNAFIPCLHCSSLMLMTNTEGHFLMAIPADPRPATPLTHPHPMM